jgi:hypothetical protein
MFEPLAEANCFYSRPLEQKPAPSVCWIVCFFDFAVGSLRVDKPICAIYIAQPLSSALFASLTKCAANSSVINQHVTVGLSFAMTCFIMKLRRSPKGPQRHQPLGPFITIYAPVQAQASCKPDGVSRRYSVHKISTGLNHAYV